MQNDIVHPSRGLGRMRIAVVGAGIGGLATAIGLQKRGHSVSVHEQAAALTEVGAGIVLAPNSQRLLAGAFGIVVSGTVRPSALHLRRWQDGSTISRQLLGAEASARFRADYVTLHRADLIDALAAGVQPGTLHLAQRTIAVRQDDDGVEVDFENGESLRADLVVAADGNRSLVAAAVGVPTIPRASGYAAYRGLASPDLIEELGDDHTAWLGPDRHFVHYPVSGGRFLNFVAVVPSPRDEPESWSSAGDIGDARAHFADWDPRVRRILACTDSVGLWGLYDRPVHDVLHAGRTVLVGDAAHPVLPFFAQGASMALEDAAVLSSLLGRATPENLADRLAAYSAARVPRVRKVQQVSYRNATMFHLADGPEQQARDARLGTPGAGDPLRDNDWLYGYDARDEAAVALAGNS